MKPARGDRYSLFFACSSKKKTGGLRGVNFQTEKGGKSKRRESKGDRETPYGGYLKSRRRFAVIWE